MYSSEILKYVRDVHNYKIEVIFGDKFKHDTSVFDKFVHKYYAIKSGRNSNTSINRETAKLLLNSGFGRTCMNLDNHEVVIVSSEEAKLLQLKYHVKSITHMTDTLELVSFDRTVNEWYSEDMKDRKITSLKETDKKRDIEQCFKLGVFITAYSTINLFEGIRHIVKKGGTVYYVDTDSIHTDVEMPESLVGGDLGQ